MEREGASVDFVACMRGEDIGQAGDSAQQNARAERRRSRGNGVKSMGIGRKPCAQKEESCWRRARIRQGSERFPGQHLFAFCVLRYSNAKSIHGCGGGTACET